MAVNSIAMTIRAKKLGVLLRDARLAAGKDVEACSTALGVTGDEFEAFETGERSPSLPQLEALAHLLNAPLDHFWGDKLHSIGQRHKETRSLENSLRVRDRIIGALLRKARLEAGLSIEDLAEQAWSSPTLIEAYELGETPVPVPDLEGLSGILHRSIKDFQDSRIPMGASTQQQRVIDEFMALSPELQAFVTRPVNTPYLELAQRLSEMQVEKLRAIAEGLLEITL